MKENRSRNLYYIFLKLIITIIIVMLFSCEKSDNKNIEKVESTNEQIKEDPYRDIYEYQGMYYYGVADSIIELIITNGMPLMRIYSVSGNEFQLDNSVEIKQFGTAQRSNRYISLNCFINNNQYKLLFAGVSPDEFMGVIKKVNEKQQNDDIPITCQDIFNAIGEYNAQTFCIQETGNGGILAEEKRIISNSKTITLRLSRDVNIPLITYIKGFQREFSLDFPKWLSHGGFINNKDGLQFKYFAPGDERSYTMVMTFGRNELSLWGQVSDNTNYTFKYTMEKLF